MSKDTTEPHFELESCRLVVVGLGLMGGSFAGALQGKCGRVIGVDSDANAIKTALQRGMIDEGTTDLERAVHGADVVVLAAPVRAILRLIDEIGALLPDGCLVMDLGSTKSGVVNAMRALPEHVQPLGGHPMCGKEISGILAADRTLYRGRTFILSPLERTTEETLARGRALVSAAGARPLILDADRQDFLVATVSHLPYLIACALVSTADVTTSADPAAWELVAGGFRDTSRLAGSDITMMIDILLTNRDRVLDAVGVFRSQLAMLEKMVEATDEQEMRQALERLRSIRKEMFP